MAQQVENDFGQPHNTALLMNDEKGTAWVCYYDDGVWWAGYPGDSKIQVNHLIVEPRA